MRQSLLVVAVYLSLSSSAMTSAQEFTPDLLGVWQAKSIVVAGKEAPPDAVKLMRMTFRKDELLVRGNFQDEREVSCKYRIDPEKKPIHFEFQPPGEKHPVLGILRIENGKLEICMRNGNKPKGRPESFAQTNDDSLVSMKFERVAETP